ncbi:MAG: putative peptidoglycan glycosyltransferase FtsW [Synergistaceae bacterium]
MKSEDEHRKVKLNINPFFWIIPIILTGIGILMIISTTSASSLTYTGTPFQMGIKQLQWFFIAVFISVFVYMMKLDFFYKNSTRFVAFSLILSFMPMVPGIGASIGGARRWIQIPGLSISIQPGELLCLAIAIHLSKLISKNKKDLLKMMYVTMFWVIIAAIPLLFQPDFGTTFLIFTVAMGIYIEKMGWKYPIILGGLTSIPAICILVFGTSYRMRRVSAFINPWDDPLNTGYQAIQGLIAFANGGFWGSGLGHGFQKLNYLPAVYTDFIFAAIGEELGLIGTLFVLLLFAFWFFQCHTIYLRSRNDFQSSLVWGITLTILMPLAINVFGVTKFIPLTGMPLPFVSYGGTSLVLMWIKVAILMRVEKEIFLEIDETRSELLCANQSF